MLNLTKNPLLLPEESEKSTSPQETSHRIQGTGIFTCIYHVINVGKYTSPMDTMGMDQGESVHRQMRNLHQPGFPPQKQGVTP